MDNPVNSFKHPSEIQHYQLYWGKPRKIAFRTTPKALHPKNSELEANNNVIGKTNKLVSLSEHGAQMGKTLMGLKSGNNSDRQVFDERTQREKCRKKTLISKENGIAEMGYDNKNSVIDVANERKKLLSLFRKQCNLLKSQSGKHSKRIDRMAYAMLNDSGELFMTHKIIGPVSGVEIEDSFDYRYELVIMGIHSQPLRGIDYKRMPNDRLLAISVVATEGYGDSMKNPDELIYAGEGGGTFYGDGNGNGKGSRDQELKGGNLALKNSVEEGNFVRVIRGIKSRRNLNATKFVYDGLYIVTGYHKRIGLNKKMQFEFTLKRCSGQKTIVWEKHK